MAVRLGFSLGRKDGIMSEIEKAYRQIDALTAEVAKLREQKFARFANEECWIYQGDGTDHLESLVCPVVIVPEKLLEILANTGLNPTKHHAG